MSQTAVALPRKIIWPRPGFLQGSGTISFFVLLVVVAILIVVNPTPELF